MQSSDPLPAIRQRANVAGVQPSTYADGTPVDPIVDEVDRVCDLASDAARCFSLGQDARGYVYRDLHRAEVRRLVVDARRWRQIVAVSAASDNTCVPVEACMLDVLRKLSTAGAASAAGPNVMQSALFVGPGGDDSASSHSTRATAHAVTACNVDDERIARDLGGSVATAHAVDGEALAVVNEQAEDDGLWFQAQTAPEAYLQAALRRLHAAVECVAARREGGEAKSNG